MAQGDFNPDQVMQAASAAGVPGAEGVLPAQPAPAPQEGVVEPLVQPAPEGQQAQEPQPEINLAQLTPEQLAEYLGDDVPVIKDLVNSRAAAETERQEFARKEQEYLLREQQMLERMQMTQGQPQPQNQFNQSAQPNQFGQPGQYPQQQYPQQQYSPQQPDLLSPEALEDAYYDDPEGTLRQVASMVNGLKTEVAQLRQGQGTLSQFQRQYEEDLAYKQLESNVEKQVTEAGLKPGVASKYIMDRLYSTGGRKDVPQLISEFKQDLGMILPSVNPPQPAGGPQNPAAPNPPAQDPAVVKHQLTQQLIAKGKQQAAKVPMQAGGQMAVPGKNEMPNMFEDRDGFIDATVGIAQAVLDTQNYV